MLHGLAKAAALAALSLTPTALAAFTPNAYFNVSLNADSPAIQYGPDALDQRFNGSYWYMQYTNSSWDSYQINEVGQGTAQAVANPPGNTSVNQYPIVAIPFTGTAIYLWGTAIPDSTTVKAPLLFWVDNQSPTNVPGNGVNESIFTYQEGLDWGNHIAYLGIVAGTLLFEGVTYTTAALTTVSDAEQVFGDIHPLIVGNSLNTDIFAYAGNWTVQTEVGGGGDQTAYPYSTAIGTNGAILRFNVPLNTSYIMINGTVGPDLGLIDFKVEPTPVYSQVSVMNQYDPWIQSARLYYVPLDPTLEYSVTIFSDTVGSGLTAMNNDKISLYSVDFFNYNQGGRSDNSNNGTSTGGLGISSGTNGTGATGNSTTTGGDAASSTAAVAKKSSNTGAIAGGVVGGVVALAAIAAALFFFCRRRSKSREQGPATFEIDESAVTSPYVQQNMSAKPMTQQVSNNNPGGYFPQQDYAGAPLLVGNAGPMGNRGSVGQVSSSAGYPTSSGYASSDIMASSGVGGVTPSMLSPGRESNGSHYAAAGAAGAAGAAAAGAYGNEKSQPMREMGQTQVAAPGGPSSAGASRAPAPIAAAIPSRVFAQEEDAGGVELIPPSYRPEWAGSSAAGSSSAGVGAGAGAAAREVDDRRPSYATSTGTGNEDWATPRGSLEKR